jgi:polyphosphate kinase
MADGTFQRVDSAEDAFNAHTYFMNNPSLSGRGKALDKATKGIPQLILKQRTPT